MHSAGVVANVKTGNPWSEPLRKQPSYFWAHAK